MKTTTEKIRVHNGVDCRWLAVAASALVLVFGTADVIAAETPIGDVSDTALVSSLPGFQNG